MIARHNVQLHPCDEMLCCSKQVSPLTVFSLKIYSLDFLKGVSCSYSVLKGLEKPLCNNLMSLMKSSWPNMVGREQGRSQCSIH